MNENENIVAEQPEVVEQVAEQPEKTYTQKEVDAIVGKRLGRQEARIRKEYDRRYGPLTEVLKAGTGKESVEEVTDSLKQFYEQKGVQIPKKPEYSQKDIEVLAKADAQEFITAGYEDVVEEVDRLAAIGTSMTAREKAVFKVLAEHRQATERTRELQNLGVDEGVYSSGEFQAFLGKFNPNTPIKDVYDIYAKTQPKKEIHTMGSMKSNVPPDSGLKDFYSYEEASKFTKADFDKNPALYKRVQESMTKW